MSSQLYVYSVYSIKCYDFSFDHILEILQLTF